MSKKKSELIELLTEAEEAIGFLENDMDIFFSAACEIKSCLDAEDDTILGVSALAALNAKKELLKEIFGDDL